MKIIQTTFKSKSVFTGGERPSRVTATLVKFANSSELSVDLKKGWPFASGYNTLMAGHSFLMVPEGSIKTPSDVKNFRTDFAVMLDSGVAGVLLHESKEQMRQDRLHLVQYGCK